MNLEDILDLTLREILEKYCIVQNLECGYIYGIFKQTDVEQVFEEYNIHEYEEAFAVENIISAEILDCNMEIKDYSKLITILENLGISKK